MGVERIKAFITGILLLTAVPASRSWAQVVMLHPHEIIANSADTLHAKKVFLAGTIDMGNSSDWQSKVAERFEAVGGKWLLFNPRQKHWDASKTGEIDYQVNWELEHLEASDLIIMNILETSKSPISLLEMGLFARSGKMYVVCPRGFYRYDNVRITCKHYGIALYDTLDQLFAEETTLQKSP